MIVRSQQDNNLSYIAEGQYLLANVKIAAGEEREASTLLAKSIHNFHTAKRERMLYFAMVSQSLVLLKIGHNSNAQQVLGEVFDFGISHQSFFHVLQATSIMALILVNEDKIAQAVELYALAAKYDYVGKSRWFADMVGQHIEAKSNELPADVVAQAQARGQDRDLWQTAESLLQELTELGWGEEAGEHRGEGETGRFVKEELMATGGFGEVLSGDGIRRRGRWWSLNA